MVEGKAEPSTPTGHGVLLSALVITKNEIQNIDRCLGSLGFCDEIVVLDSGSQDGTVEAARRYTQNVFVEPWRGYAAQKERALLLCRGSWILWIDADEAVSPELATAIGRAVRDPGKMAGFLLRRKVRYLGRWVHHGGWERDWVLRLFRKESGRFSERFVHEGLLLDGPSLRLPGILEHHSYRDLGHHWEKIGQFSALWAEGAHAEGQRARLHDLLFRPPARWLKLFVFRLGFLDGWRGLVIASLAAAYVFLKYARLREKEASR